MNRISDLDRQLQNALSDKNRLNDRINELGKVALLLLEIYDCQIKFHSRCNFLNIPNYANFLENFC